MLLIKIPGKHRFSCRLNDLRKIEIVLPLVLHEPFVDLAILRSQFLELPGAVVLGDARRADQAPADLARADRVADGVLGLDYKFRGAPINMSIDWQPSFEFGAGRGFVGSWGGLGIRYTF